MRLEPTQRVVIDWLENQELHNQHGMVHGVNGNAVVPKSTTYLVKLCDYRYDGGYDTVCIPECYLRKADHNWKVTA